MGTEVKHETRTLSDPVVNKPYIEKQYSCIEQGCAERGLCGSNKCDRWVRYQKDLKRIKEEVINDDNP